MRQLFLGFSLCTIVLSGVLSFTMAASEPVERNIVYVHVPAAISAIVCFIVLFISSALYLRTSRPGCDYSAAAAAEVGFIFATVLNLTGSIFARAQWNTWWTLSPRLISSAAMWFLLVAYLLLRAALAGHSRKGSICAVFGIIAFVDVPLVIISARFVRDIHRPSISFEAGWQYFALVLAVVGMILLALVLVWIRTDILKIKKRFYDEI